MNKLRIISCSQRPVTKIIKRFKMNDNKDKFCYKQQPTHLISIPFCVGEVRERYLNFKKEILEKFEDFDEVLFQNPNKLHMTLGVMTLPSKKEQADAKEVLKKCKADVIHQILKDHSLKIRISGVDVLDNDAKKARVVFGKVNENYQELWQTLCDGVADYFIKADLIQKEYNQVKMHITLMNTVFRRKSPVKEVRKNRKPIDVSSIIKEYENYDFGETTVNALHLSDMRAVSSSGYYKPELILDLKQYDLP